MANGSDGKSPAKSVHASRLLKTLTGPKPEWQLAKELGARPQDVLSCLINLEQKDLVYQTGRNWRKRDDNHGNHQTEHGMWSQLFNAGRRNS